MSGTNSSVQLNENTTAGAQMWVVEYTEVSGESGTVDAQVVNIVDSDGNLVGPSNPLAVDATFGAASVTVEGSVSVTNFPATQTVSGSVAVMGTVGIDNYPTSQTVAGSVSVLNLPATQAVSGSVSVINLPASQLISGSVAVVGTVAVDNFPTTQPISGSVSVSNFPASQVVSGSVSVINTFDNQAVSGSVSVVGTVGVSNFPTTQAVSGSVAVTGTVGIDNYPTSQTVAGSVSVLNLPSTQAVSGSVNVLSLPTVQPVAGSVTVPILGFVEVNAGVSPTYAATASVTGLLGDVWMINGSASKIVRVRAVRIQATASVAVATSFQLIKRSTADIGTHTTVTGVPYNSSFAAATASVVAFTATPTGGTPVGVLEADRVILPTTTGPSADIEWEFGDRPNSGPVVLNTVSENLCVNLNPLPSNPVIWITTEWTEDSS